MTVKVRCPNCGATKRDYRTGVPEGAICSEVCGKCEHVTPEEEPKP